MTAGNLHESIITVTIPTSRYFASRAFSYPFKNGQPLLIERVNPCLKCLDSRNGCPFLSISIEELGMKVFKNTASFLISLIAIASVYITIVLIVKAIF